MSLLQHSHSELCDLLEHCLRLPCVQRRVHTADTLNVHTLQHSSSSVHLLSDDAVPVYSVRLDLLPRVTDTVCDL